MAKKTGIVIGLGFGILTSVLIFWFYFSKPQSFPSDQLLLKKMNATLLSVNAVKIQDTIKIDDRHFFVPFLTHKGRYGISVWFWDKHKWQVGMIEEAGEPKLWKIKGNEPSTYHLLWNIHPDDQLSYMKTYLMRDKNYIVSGEKETYMPKVQLEVKISLERKAYGVKKVPKDWISYLDTVKQVESDKQLNIFSSFMDFDRQFYFSWIPFNQENKEANPMHSVNGGGYQSGIEVEYLRRLSQSDLE